MQRLASFRRRLAGHSRDLAPGVDCWHERVDLGWHGHVSELELSAYQASPDTSIFSTGFACSFCSNPLLSCSWLFYRVTIAETSRAAVDLAFSGVPTYHYDPILLLEPPPLQRRGRELGPQRLLRGGLNKEEANCLNCSSASGSRSACCRRLIVRQTTANF